MLFFACIVDHCASFRRFSLDAAASSATTSYHASATASKTKTEAQKAGDAWVGAEFCFPLFWASTCASWSTAYFFERCSSTYRWCIVIHPVSRHACGWWLWLCARKLLHRNAAFRFLPNPRIPVPSNTHRARPRPHGLSVFPRTSFPRPDRPHLPHAPSPPHVRSRTAPLGRRPTEEHNNHHSLRPLPK